MGEHLAVVLRAGLVVERLRGDDRGHVRHDAGVLGLGVRARQQLLVLLQRRERAALRRAAAAPVQGLT